MCTYLAGPSQLDALDDDDDDDEDDDGDHDDDDDGEKTPTLSFELTHVWQGLEESQAEGPNEATGMVRSIITLVKKSSSNPKPMAKQDKTWKEMFWHFCMKLCTTKAASHWLPEHACCNLHAC